MLNVSEGAGQSVARSGRADARGRAKNAGLRRSLRAARARRDVRRALDRQLTNPHGTTRSIRRRTINEHGVEQGTCVHLGNCDIGCDVNARNTLDLNYLAVAEKKGADVRPLHLVRDIEPHRTAATASHFERIDDGTMKGRHADSANASSSRPARSDRRELLLRVEGLGKPAEPQPAPGLGLEQQRRLPDAGDSSVPGRRSDATARRSPPRSICSTASIRGKSIFIEDGGIPDIGRAFLDGCRRSRTPIRARSGSAATPAAALRRQRLLNEHVMPWFAQSRDAADGRMRLDARAADARLGHHRVGRHDERRRVHMHQQAGVADGRTFR